MNDAGSVRCFVAVWVDAAGRAGLAPRLAAARDRFPAVRWVRDAQLHLTLAFVAQATPAELAAVREALDSVAGRAVEPVALDRQGRFPAHGPPQVFWLGAGEPGGVVALQAALAGELEARGVRFDRKPFRPHVTLGRVRRAVDTAEAAAIREHFAAGLPVGLDMTGLALVQSLLGPGGPDYRELHRVALGGPG